ncbi:MAG TPA: DUF4350 domain-containing protein [Thermodesulfobacteriota bacterium]
MKKIILLFAALSMLILYPFTEGYAATAGKPAAKKAAPKAAAHTVFDFSHAEIFSPVANGELDYTSFHEMIKASGATTAVNTETVTSKRLSGVKTYVIAGPAMSFTEQEGTALKNFVKNGGNLLILAHISPPVAPLTNMFGILISNFVVAEQNNTIEGRSQDFLVTKFSEHPVTTGIEKIAVYGTWGLMTEPKTGSAAVIVASTSEKAFADLNRNRALSEGEPVQEFGIIAVGGLGKGKVVVVADDAPFTNKFLGQADNRKLASNIIGWLK